MGSDIRNVPVLFNLRDPMLGPPELRRRGTQPKLMHYLSWMGPHLLALAQYLPKLPKDHDYSNPLALGPAAGHLGKVWSLT